MRRLAVFARSPMPGTVKSRLSPAFPERLAANLYAGLLADTIVAAIECPADERFVYWADAPGEALGHLVSRPQRGADLGERLTAVFEELLLEAGDRALIVGSDAPALTAASLVAAFEALARHDAVLGPARDGGYWCVGLARRAPELFRGIPWSTREVLAHTLERARSAGLRAATSSMLDDLDTPADLARLVGALVAGRTACGVTTRAALVAAGLLPPWAEATAMPA